DLKAEQQRAGPEQRELYERVTKTLERFQLPPREMSSDGGVSIQAENDRQLVRQMAEQYRALPAELRRKVPALLNSLALLQAAVGDLDAAQKDFEAVAPIVSGDALARATATHNAYRAALARRRWDEALALLKQALALDAQRFSPFPLDRFE